MSSTNPNPTAIKSVGYYIATPVECCDRCGQGIKHVYPVALKDGTVFKYGGECIGKVLEGDTSLLALWKKNAKLLQQLKRDLEVLNRPWSEIPAGKVAFNSRPGDMTRFISHEDGGSWMTYGRMCFHADHYNPDQFDGRALYEYASDHGRFNTVEEWRKRCEAGREDFKKQIAAQIARIEPFLARILAKGLAGQQAKEVVA